MKNSKNKGFVLLLVIMLIAMIGIIVSVLTEASNTMVFQSNKTYLRACERNLIASGLAWSKINLQKESGDIPDKMIELDVTDMNIRGSSLSQKSFKGMADMKAVRLKLSLTFKSGHLAAVEDKLLEATGHIQSGNDKQKTIIRTRQSPTCHRYTYLCRCSDFIQARR